MAESSKRNSIAGKVATPKTAGASAGQPLPETHEAIAKAIGAVIKLTTVAPESKTYDGTLYTADPISNLVIVNTRTPSVNPSADVASQPGDYRIIPISRIQSFQIVSLASGGDVSESGIAGAKPSVTEVDVKRLQKRADERVKVLQEEERSRGKGVGKEAQAIFDAFRRINMQPTWHAKEIIVLESVIITAPYRAEDCRAPKERMEALNRVKKALEGERRKLKEKEDRERKTATPTGPRKGG